MLSLVQAPVLLIVYNRPETTEKVFEAIRKAKPNKLYIASDAPQLMSQEDKHKCFLVKKIVQQVDWECDRHYRFADTNQGCGLGPFNAISWAFENEDRLIILEDDCVPAISFFKYCNDLLELYKNDNRIWLISGNQYNEEAVRNQCSYFFSRYGHSQGWATWKRCWTQMDLKMSKWPLIVEQKLFNSFFPTKKENSFFKKKYDFAYANNELISHSWDIQFSFAIRSNSGLSIIPNKNLVSNVGHVGTHSNKKLWFHDRPVDELYEIKLHSEFVLCDVNYDDYHFKHHWNRKPFILTRILRKVFRIIIRLFK